ncbi:U4/U6.U5 tri-snRNP-associated protein 1 [Babesia microti strain RI]|uniref:U4/U6.U5 tri-snRNP-associated protein 1 n=1 Tax=Babesia microti (strain RI) TaxID=1133968 RepID=A0A1N6LXK1_BABMR|nr:U4/U6.U5 tri-snRNP-associated protein 1 [Babesia microti strain RI]SIO73608.1 U4/U6.U5 tri-snRNP-associated protein 1 [Babesia microti strain RI]|eukprot:XP_021337692.1 U4/U6.U5 tri-snRNP-associated protein 1 [Babesia microti strain RI]
MSADNQVESLSTDETNDLRIKLGLKPLYNDPKPKDDSTTGNSPPDNTIKYSADTEVTYVAPVLESKKAIEIERQLNERLNHRARAELIKGPSIAQSLNDDPLDPLIWAQKQRIKQKAASKQRHVTYSDDEFSPIKQSHQLNPSESTNDPSMDIDGNDGQIKVVHDYKHLDTNSILTLCDTGILEAQEEGMEDIDYLQSTDLADKERMERNISGKKGKPLSYEDYVANAMDDTGKKNILEKYDEVIHENERSSFKNFFKGFFMKKPNTATEVNINDTNIVIGNESTCKNSAARITTNSAHVDDIESLAADDSGYNSAPESKRNKFIKKAIPKISKRAKVPDWDELFTDTSAPPAPGYAVPSAPDPPSPIPIIRPRRAVDHDMPSDDMDNMLYQQLTKHRRVTNRSVPTHVSNSVKLENIKQDQFEVKYEISQVDEFCKSVESTTLSKNIKNDNKYSYNTNQTTSTSDTVSHSPTVVTKDAANPLEELPLDCGIANTLKYLKTKGQLEPVHSEQNEIKLNYINKYGKTMTPKEAFKELCYSFHGKLPGKNKQEKRLRKIEMELRLLQNPTDSLPTMRALAQNQKADKCAHIVLDGGSNLLK